MSAVNSDQLERWLKCAWTKSRRNEREIIEIAVENLILGNDVLAVLPTGFAFGKNLSLYYISSCEARV